MTEDVPHAATPGKLHRVRAELILRHASFGVLDQGGAKKIGKTTMAIYGYGSIPINTIFSGMNIHLPAILMFTRGTRF